MMSKKVLKFSVLLAILVVSKLSLNASNTDKFDSSSSPSTWEYYSTVNEAELDNLCASYQNTKFTPKISALRELMKATYLKKDQVSSGDASTTIQIKHPKIYSSVRSIEKYFTKKSKQKQLTTEDLDSYAHVLRVAISLVDIDDLDAFEELLTESKKDVKNQITLFNEVKLVEIY